MNNVLQVSYHSGKSTSKRVPTFYALIRDMNISSKRSVINST